MPPPGPGRGIWRWMAVRGYALRAAELAGAAAGPVTSVALLIAGCALLGVAAAGGGGAVVAIVLAAVLVAVGLPRCGPVGPSPPPAPPGSAGGAPPPPPPGGGGGRGGGAPAVPPGFCPRAA